MFPSKLEWPGFKALVAQLVIPIRYFDRIKYYEIYASDSDTILSCVLHKSDPKSADQVDFETNYQTASNQTKTDSDGSDYIRTKASKRGWTYHVGGIKVTIGTLNSVVHKKYDDTNLGGCSLKIYKSDGSGGYTQITDPADEAYAIKTQLDVTLPYDFEIIGGNIRWKGDIADDTYLSMMVAPVLADKVMIEGVDLSFLNNEGKIESDGRAAKFLTYTEYPPSSGLYTNTMRIIVYHATTTKHEIMLTPNIYRV